jgi:hypothetical protein
MRGQAKKRSVRVFRPPLMLRVLYDCGYFRRKSNLESCSNFCCDERCPECCQVRPETQMIAMNDSKSIEVRVFAGIREAMGME